MKSYCFRRPMRCETVWITATLLAQSNVKVMRIKKTICNFKRSWMLNKFSSFFQHKMYVLALCRIYILISGFEQVTKGGILSLFCTHRSSVQNRWVLSRHTYKTANYWHPVPSCDGTCSNSSYRRFLCIGLSFHKAEIRKHVNSRPTYAGPI